MSILMLMLFGIIPSSAISTLSMGNTEFSAVGESAMIDFYLDVVPDGLVGGNYLVHIENDSIASISEIKFPPWVLLKANSPNLRNDVWLKVLAQPPIMNGTTNVYLGSVKVTAHKIGSTAITIQLSDPTDIRNLKYWFEDVNGNVISIKVIPGMITVKENESTSDSTTALLTGSKTLPPSVSTTVPRSGSITVPSTVSSSDSTTNPPAVSTTVPHSTPEKSSIPLLVIFIGGILGALLYFQRWRKD
jgi:hypothetical protein